MVNLLKLNSLVMLTLLVSSNYLFSQSIEEINGFKSTYKGYNIVHNTHKATVKIDIENGVPVVRTSLKDDFVLLNQNVVSSMSQDEIGFTSFDTIETMNAYSLIYDGKKFKKVKANNFLTKSMSNEGDFFHDDKQVTSFMYPSLSENSYRILEYTELSKENRFPFGFFFSSYIPVVNAEFSIDCDSSIHILSKLFNSEISQYNYKEEIVKKRRIITWQINDPLILKSDDRAASSRYYAPHLMAQISHYYKDGKRVNVLSSTKDLHDWNKVHIKNVVNEVPDENLKHIADSVVKGISSEVEKVKAIYYWVQNNIKYIAFEEGENGFVPRQASAICLKRYGDCKDMATLIYSMLKYLNVPAYLTWVGTRDLPYKYTDFPSTVCDNHMITTYFDNETPYFLDATNSFLTYGYPSYAIQGKQAFVHISNDEFKILEIPVMKKEQTSWRDTCFINIEGSKLLGKSRSLTSGYYNFYVNDVYKDKEQEKIIDIVQGLHKKGNNTFKVTNPKITNIGDRTKDLKVEFDFEVNNYITSYEDEVYVNMVLDKEITNGEFKKERLAPFELASLSADQYTVVLAIPTGYKVKSLPNKVSYNSEDVDFEVLYRQEGNNVFCTINLNLKFLLLYPTSFDKWNEFVKIQKAAFIETVVLKKTN